MLRFTRLFAASVILSVLSARCPAQDAADPEPVGHWRFDGEDQRALAAKGKATVDADGPRPPVFPDFSDRNTAAALNGRSQYFVLPDDESANGQFDFTNGDEITIEAWVQCKKIANGQYAYVIGKGRTGGKGFAANNQNWALRLFGAGGRASLSFLFATQPPSGSPWHRWTTTAGFVPGKMWHHVAITYRFGDPDSIRGWIDGTVQPGKWDMGGKTQQPPVVDDDAIWIGSSMGGNPGSSFNGSLDSIAVFRTVLPDEVLKSRYRRVGGEDDVLIGPAEEVVPSLPALSPDNVLMTFHEGMPARTRWLNTDEQLPPETLRWHSHVALIDRLPQRFDDWGIRSDWKRPVLMRIAAEIEAPPGTHRLLMRVRGLSRLWFDGKIVGRAKPLTGSPSGEEPMTPVRAPLVPGMRVAEHRQQEVVCEVTVNESGRGRLILETLVGGKSFRTDPGETCLAIESEPGKSFSLIRGAESPQASVSLTDAETLPALVAQEDALAAFDAERRRAAAATQNKFWEKRHSLARNWVQDNPPPAVPETEPRSTDSADSNSTGQNPVDAFIDEKVHRALTASAEHSIESARQFHKTILPVLRDNCFRCHSDKASGGLSVNSREAILSGGDSELPAVVPGDVETSELIRRLRSEDEYERMPPGDPLPEESIALLENWIHSGAAWPAPPVTESDVEPSPRLTDHEFARRAYLDCVGVIPSKIELQHFLQDTQSDKRQRLIRKLLADDRFADHWLPYWQDLLAENPTLVNASLNSTGPFRWFLYDAIRDHKPMDRMVTELILMRGSKFEGGSAGFGVAGNNDAPFAAKAQIVASAFLGTDLQCARCHDSPYHSTKQRDLYSLAAMLKRKPLKIPASSRVPAAFFADQERESLIEVSLKPDATIEPTWPFEEFTHVPDDVTLNELVHAPDDPRERLAALVTSPANRRFSRVIVNRVWRRLMGAGIVEPPDDWEGVQPSHQELLDWLSAEFLGSGYDLRHMVEIIMTSAAYQRSAVADNRSLLPEQRFFVAPDRRRMSAEQIVDSMLAASGQPLDVEELTFDPDGRRPSSNRLTMGTPTRAWMFMSLGNERDRPSLGLPRARAVTDIMKAFGWNGSRQNPRTDRETAPNVLQPGVLANSTLSVLLTRATDGSGLAELALAAGSPGELVDSIYLKYLSRLPRPEERAPLVEVLTPGFASRIVPDSEITPQEPLPLLRRITWSNHLRSDSNSIALELEKRARAGTAADPRLTPEWREAYEDVVWSVLNLSEFVWLP